MKALATVASLALVSAALVQPVPDTTVKAAFVARFPEFVAWPADDRAPARTLSICLSSSHPFGTRVAQSALPSIRGRPIRVRALGRDDEIDDCHVLYVAEAEISLLRRAQGLPILTVGDQADFLQLGGIINLRVVDRRVRFDVDLVHARRVGLAIDTQLLRLAAVVHGGRT